MDDLYFPYLPASLMESEKRLRAVAASLPERNQLELYATLSTMVERFTETQFEINDDGVEASQRGTTIIFPRPLPLVKLALICFGYKEWLRRKYALPGFVEVSAGDIVVDCGAYVGGFSLSAAEIAGRVFAFEPDPTNAACARANLLPFGNVEVVEKGLLDRSGEMHFNRSANNVEHSFLAPDDGTVVERIATPIATLADFAAERSLSCFDFVKIEAEGVELEVFAGLADLRPGKLAIDVSPERDGKSPAAEFHRLLEALGYELRQRKHVLFARLAA